MKKNIPYILAGIAVVNLIWLFVFNYRLPDLSALSGRNETQAQSREITPEEEGVEIALQEEAEETAAQEPQAQEQETQEPQADDQAAQEPQQENQEAPAADAGQNNQEAEAPAAEKPAETPQTPQEPPKENETAEKPAEQNPPAPQQPQEEPKKEKTCRSGEGNTPNIRSGPGTSYDILKTADFNEVMVVTGEPVRGWIPVRTKEGYEGFVSSDMVDMLD